MRIDGYDIFEESGKAKKLVGYLPEQPPLYMNESPVEYLRFVGEAKGLRGAELMSQIEEVIRQTKIEDVKNRRLSALSKGYKQRVGIAQALLGNPKVIILDEPTVGLDPIQIIEIRALIKELVQTHTVIFSSHILSEVQAICDQIMMIAQGKLVAFDTPENLEKRLLAPNEIIITADVGAEEIKEILVDISHITEIDTEEKNSDFIVAHIKTDHDNIYDISRAVFLAFAAREKALLEMTLKRGNLEDVFIELSEGGTDILDVSEDDRGNECCAEEHHQRHVQPGPVKKVRSAMGTRAARGEYMGALVPYGYLKNPENVHQLIPDEEAAETVRLIFNMAAQGKKKSEIARYLNEQGIPTCKEHFRKIGLNRPGFHEKEKKLWTVTTIGDMLKNAVYVGMTVWNKTRQICVGSKKLVKNDRSEWTIIEGTHEMLFAYLIQMESHKSWKECRNKGFWHIEMLEAFIFLLFAPVDKRKPGWYVNPHDWKI